MTNNNTDIKVYSKHYSDDGFWSKLRNLTLKSGKKLINKAMVLYYVAVDEDTPAWAKAIIYGALGYFILPIDAVPDFIPLIGFSDDLTALFSAFTAIQSNVTQKHIEKANLKLKDWF